MSERTDLKVGFACNNRCAFCAQGGKRDEQAFIPREELEARMRRAFRPGRGLVLTGGEPTIHKQIIGIVETGRAIGYQQIQIQTNGRALAYRALVARLRRAGVTEFSPALHGADAETHDALTRAPGSFQQTVDGIRNAVESGAGVVTNSVVVRQNLAQLGAIVEMLASLGVKRAQLALVHPVGTAACGDPDVVPRLSDAAPAAIAAVRVGRERGVEVVVEAMPLCFMRGSEDAVVEARIPETTVVDADGEPFAFSDWRRETGKAKGPPCEDCARARECEGPWREYPQLHGWSEYAPFTDE